MRLMRLLLLIVPIIFVGCRTAPLPTFPLPSASPVVPVPLMAPPPAVPPPTIQLEQKIRQQAQIIEALISQNDALMAKLAASATTTGPTITVAPPAVASIVAPALISPATVAPAVPASVPSPEFALTPDAEGVIDLTATASQKPDELVNPFTVRSAPKESVRDVTLHVGGIVAGPNVCAIVNDQLIQPGDTLESFSVERIESDAVFLRREGQRMRLPVSAQPIRVRMPL